MFATNTTPGQRSYLSLQNASDSLTRTTLLSSSTRVPPRCPAPGPTADGEVRGADWAAWVAGEGPADGGHLGQVADAAGERLDGDEWRSGVSPGVDSEGDVVMDGAESNQESEYSLSWDSRDEARLIAFWARVMPELASAAQFEPPTLRHLFQHGDTADALSRTLKRRLDDLLQSWSMRIDVF